MSESECQGIRSEAESWKPSKESVYNDADYIIDGIYLGNVCAAHNKSWLDQEGITYVISVSTEWEDFPYYGENYNERMVDFFHFPLGARASDDDRERVMIVFYQVSSLMNNIFHLAERLKRKERILIHSGMGVSRSSSALLWYLKHFSRYSQVPYEQIESFVKAKRPVIQPSSLYKDILLQSNSIDKGY